ncbi:hypothetical protein X743_10200 [Mesorhizobium sp. LNHC252B00]|nr:hypothetical protein X743_10200 [Mesorhizobium sp. LNHC252B00]
MKHFRLKMPSQQHLPILVPRDQRYLFNVNPASKRRLVPSWRKSWK